MANLASEKSVAVTQRRAECLIVAALLAFGSHALPFYVTYLVSISAPDTLKLWTWGNISSWLALVYGLLLALSTPRRSGLCLGTISESWKGVLLVCGGPLAVALVVYPFLPIKPWGGASYHMWLTSPLAQDAVFIGYLYGHFDRLFPERVWRRLPVPSSLLLTAAFFMAWHIPNLFSLPLGYVLFQLFYTFAGCLITGLSRVWTGSTSG